MSDIDSEIEKLGLEKLPRDSAEGWFKFENIGDGIAGEIVDMFYIPAKDGMNEQRGFTLKRSDGSLYNVGIKWTLYMLSRTDNLEIGDTVAFKFDKEIPAKVKGYNPAKSIVVMTKLKANRTGQTAALFASPGGSTHDSEAEKLFDSVDEKDEKGINPDDVPFP